MIPRSPRQSGNLHLDVGRLLRLYSDMLLSRRIDEQEEILARRGEAFFFVPSSGHEAMAALAHHLNPSDWLHCHYRDKALVLARGLAPEEMFYILLGKAESASGGRRMPGFVSEPSLNIVSSSTLVGNSALHAVGVALRVKEQRDNPIVVCTVGDGGTQQGEYLEAIAEAVRSQLPVLFVIEDNRFALSTRTHGNTFYSHPEGEAETFYGLDVNRVDGTDPVAVDEAFADLVSRMRVERNPVLLVVNSERLTSHTNADDQSVYRDTAEIDDGLARGDPIRNLEDILKAAGVDDERFSGIRNEIDSRIGDALATARLGKPSKPEFEASVPFPPELVRAAEYRGASENRTVGMLEAVRETLRHHLASDPDVTLFGQDIEDPKGDVFGLTRGLSTDFPERVVNSALSEATIVGTSIGRALAGGKPVAFLQFADFLPVAYNQIMSEMGAMHWRSKGQWQCPVIIIAVCGGYRPGLGPYHSQNPESIVAHVPGVDVLSPSTAADAAGLLNAAFLSGRPTVMFFPKNLLNDRDVATSVDLGKHMVPIGKALERRSGEDLTIVTWSSTMPICQRAADALESAGISTEIIDLRSVSPWDKDAVIASARKTGKLLVVHEDNHTCGMGGEICATVAEAVGSVDVARLARADTLVPYEYSSHLQVLPSYRSVLTRAAEMLSLELHWEAPVTTEAGMAEIKALGSGPSDETVTISEIFVSGGDRVDADAVLVSVETNKAVVEISTPFGGVVDEVLVGLEDEVAVNAPIVRIRTDEETGARPVTEENPGHPVLTRMYHRAPGVSTTGGTAANDVVLSSTCSVLGSRVVTNEDILDKYPNWNSREVLKRTGIESRHWVAEGESALTLGVDACRRLLEREALRISDIDVLICSTGTPLQMTPSLSCQILEQLSPGKGQSFVQAYDINAACSGYLYALQSAHDHLKSDPDLKILVVTSEVLSPLLDDGDPGTYFLFGDAATASLVSSEVREGNVNARVFRPVLSANGEAPEILSVPFAGTKEFVRMDGPAVFRAAVRRLAEMMRAACTAADLEVNDIDLIVPHQANERILHAVRKLLQVPEEKILINIRGLGNTSSNTIPLGLEEVASEYRRGQKIGMMAFGGGFTFGSGILEIL